MKARQVAILASVLALALCATVHANGKFYYSAPIPSEVPFQRALIIAEEGQETLLLQSTYQVPADSPFDPASQIGWVVPVPAVPELASMDAYEADGLFRTLARRTVAVKSDYWSAVLGLAFMLFLIYACYRENKVVPPARQSRNCACLTLILLIVGPFTLLSVPGMHGCSAPSAGVDVVSEKTVGAYNVKVIDAEESTPLLEWLRENDFEFGEEDEGVFRAYIDRGWCFVVARVAMAHGGSGTGEPVDDPVDTADTAPEEPEPVVGVEGLVAPLLLRFETDELVYPMALTSLAGSKTMVRIYTLTDHRVTGGPRLKAKAAWPIDHDYLNRYPITTLDPPDFFPEPDPKGEVRKRFLCRFEGELTSAQMQSDLYFERAPDDEPFRITIRR